MHNIDDNALHGCLSENYLTRNIIEQNILDTKYLKFMVHVSFNCYCLCNVGDGDGVRLGTSCDSWHFRRHSLLCPH